MLNQGSTIYDCDIKVDRQQPLDITASKIKHLVYLLNTGNFTHQARCTIIDLVPDNLGTKLLNCMDDSSMTETLRDCSDEDPEIDDQTMPEQTSNSDHQGVEEADDQTIPENDVDSNDVEIDDQSMPECP